jgi:endonuclease/exonuclease/phosphatase family metal-dependent hydrolase
LQETGFHGYHDDRESAYVKRNSFISLAKTFDKRLISWRTFFAPEVDTAYHQHATLWNRSAYDSTVNGGLASGAEGNAVLSNLTAALWPWPHHTGHRIPLMLIIPSIVTQISQASLYSTGTRDTQPRNLILTSVEHLTYGPLVFMNTHLGTVTGEDRHDPVHPQSATGEARRLHQVGEIVRVTREFRQAEVDNGHAPRPIVLVGDFNAVPGSAPMQLLEQEYHLLPVENPEADRWTHRDHKILIDHILISDPARILPEPRVFIQTDLPYDDLTDHRPVIAVFE